ncbi:DUF2627 domain-containing protein [Bacillus horti]|uniref:Ni/Fe-hydrogenase subunit HybB-like protein n=1 Tax=Caldalkalibacillus horti TaxID=77523 RepID=A0ABT9W0R8_9BACI|nr:DUF2627 domain-containing protein [Bacillus horti]MDQ0166858.1 Ni/Fe-hydrogenase subunit HybB-like protein [Bacillus horti]
MRAQRLVALLILVIPGALGMYGVKLLRDALFSTFDPETGFRWGIFIAGLLLFVLGILFIAGFIFYSDKKKKLVQPRFKNDIDDED